MIIARTSCRFSGALTHAADKAFVDFQQGDGQVIQVHKRRETGAKIVQRETHPQTRQRQHGLLHLIAAAHHRGFGQLELQPLASTPRSSIKRLRVGSNWLS